MKTFEERKKHVLWKMSALDKSKKGSVDEPIIKLLDVINDHPGMYTTSSCSGRILLLKEPLSEKKNMYEWPYVTHELADSKAIKEIFSNINTKCNVWLRMQTAIIHVACKDLLVAEDLLEQFYNYGWKRSGIFSLKNDVMVELLSVESMDSLIMFEGERLVDDKYIDYFVKVANKKLLKIHEKIDLATQRVKSLILKSNVS